jgi:hypothetical protein
VSSNGTVLDPDGIPIGATTVPDTRPIPTWEGTNWLVAWQVTRATNEVVAAPVSPQGSLLDQPQPVSDSPHFGAMAASSAGPGAMVVAYSWLLPGPPDNAIRAFLRFVGE